MPKKQLHEYTVVHNDMLCFITHDSSEGPRINHRIELKSLLDTEEDTDKGADKQPVLFPADVRFTKNSLLIVPDYWFGNAVYPLHSHKERIVRPFIERKLQTDHPELSEISLFYDYSGPDNGNLFVYFLLDQRCFLLYHRLSAMGVCPQRITSPAFIWAQRLAHEVTDFNKTGCCLVHLAAKESFLYFFSQGRFLFSRSIGFPESLRESSGKFSALAYEINQSVFLFSQKAKRELQLILLVSSDPQDIGELSDRMDLPIQAFHAGGEAMGKDRPLNDRLGPVTAFERRDLSPAGKYLFISHKLERKTREWKPVQLAAMTIGVIVLLLLGIKTVYLWRWPSADHRMHAAPGINFQQDPQTMLYQYSDALDLALMMTERRSLKETFLQAIKSIPDGVSIKSLDIVMAPETTVSFTCRTHTADISELSETLAAFTQKIDTAFSGTGLVNKQDIKISPIDEKQMDLGYDVEFRMSLP